MTDSLSCKYTSLETNCKRSVLDNEEYCIFHYAQNVGEKEKSSFNFEFQSAFDLLVNEEDGLWDGFVFPENIVFPRSMDFPVFVRDACFISLHLKNVIFKNKVDFSRSTFLGDTKFQQSTFDNFAVFNQCHFDGSFELFNTHFNQDTSFHNTVFSKQALFRVNFKNGGSFHNAIFKEGVSFNGWKINTGCLTVKVSQKEKPSPITKLSYQELQSWFSSQDKRSTIVSVFENGGGFTNVIFLKPKQVSFSQVDLSKVIFNNTDLRGVRFQGVNWRQPQLKRNGLYEEQAIFLTKNKDHRSYQLPSLEDSYRNTRLALEENKDFNTASDFYIGEMDVIRAQLPPLKCKLFSIAALYNIVSQYGTSVTRAFSVLLGIFVFHFLFTVLNTILVYELEEFPIDTLGEQLLRSINVLTLQVPIWKLSEICPLVLGGTYQKWVDIICRILFPMQLTMLILSFRTRIKRY